MLRTRAVRRAVKRDVRTVVVQVGSKEPDAVLDENARCRGGAFGDPDLCLTHEGHRIPKGYGGRCVYILTPVGEDVP